MEIAIINECDSQIEMIVHFDDGLSRYKTDDSNSFKYIDKLTKNNKTKEIHSDYNYFVTRYKVNPLDTLRFIAAANYLRDTILTIKKIDFINDHDTLSVTDYNILEDLLLRLKDQNNSLKLKDCSFGDLNK